MKAGIHPEYLDCEVKCVCGHTFQTRSTNATLKVDICSNCHPFYTGKQKFVDSAGRVEKFGKKYNWDASAKETIQQAAKAKRRKTRKEKVTVGIPTFKRKAAEEAPPAAKADAPKADAPK